MSEWNNYCAAFLLLLSGGGCSASANILQRLQTYRGFVHGRAKIYMSINDHDGRDIDSATVHNQSFHME